MSRGAKRITLILQSIKAIKQVKRLSDSAIFIAKEKFIYINKRRPFKFGRKIHAA
jgi:hypothetical protein